MARTTPSRKRGLASEASGKATRLNTLLAHPAARWTLLALFLLATVAVMTAGFQRHEVWIDSGQLGARAPRTILTTRDFTFTIKHIDATEQRRERVAASVPPVYDWREDLGESLRDAVHKAMGSMRAAMGESIRQKTPQPERSPAQPPLPTPPPRTDAELIAAQTPEQRVELAKRLRASAFDAHFPIIIEESTFEQLARRGFDPVLESAMAYIVREAMRQSIVPSARVLEEERERGLYLRRMRRDTILIEYHVADLSERVVGMESMPGKVRELARRRAGELPAAARQALIVTALQLVRPNTTVNEAQTQARRQRARQAVPDITTTRQWRKGEVLIEKGATITERDVRMFEAMVAGERAGDHVQTLLGLLVLVVLLFSTLFIFARRDLGTFRLQQRDYAFLGVTVLLFLALVRIGKAMSFALLGQVELIPAQAWQFMIPVAAFGMLTRLIVRTEAALVFSLVFGMLCGMLMDGGLFYAAFTVLGCLTGATLVRQVKHRMALMWSGLIVGALNVVAVLGMLLWTGELLHLSTIFYVLMGLSGGLLSGFFVSATLPVFEAGFGYTTDIKLLELSDLNHPLLRELIVRAPGSYHHSMMVGSLCEAAAESIGCNSLLARVGAYYHDIGKTRNPGYFAENQKFGENPHDKLKPNMSALIIKAHVKDGIEMARQHRLPEEIVDFIAQHHGTSLIRYFYHRAKQMEDPDIPEVDEKDYRYPGPKPQTRETAICLLADGIEAASRAMPNPTPVRLKGLVQHMINQAFTDGQLDECDLTLKDLNAIAQAFMRILTGIYHHRPEYPEQKKPQAAQAAQSAQARKDPKEGRPEVRSETLLASARHGKPRPTTTTPSPTPTGGTPALSGEDAEADRAERDEAAPPSPPDASPTEDEQTPDADRADDARRGDEPPAAKKPPADDFEQGRAPLPRLGSS